MTVQPVLSFALAAVLSFVPDALAVPRARLRRAPAAVALHAVAAAFFCCVTFALTARVAFAACVAVVLVGLAAAVSNAKYASLREPFVFTDLSLFCQLFAHPRLYLPFLNATTVVAIVAGVLLLATGLWVEIAVTPHPWFPALLAACVCLLVGCRLAATLPLALDPMTDQHAYGFFAVFVAYLLNGFRPATVSAFEQAAAASPFASGAPGACPDVLLIQSESYFDARRACPSVASSLYTQFDRACRESVCHGRLSVPAWGANTMRTEFSVLTGLASSRLGYARFYPYAFLRRTYASLAHWFARAGYRCIAIHPYYADFFGRDRVYPLLGFDRLVDIRAFAAAPRAGAYVADAAVADALIAELDALRAGPMFLFAMTMENHGPLHLESVWPGESAARHSLGDGPEWRDLTAYLRHLEHADAMIGRLLDHLCGQDRDTVLCFYGDHVPALGPVFDKLDVAPGHSDFFIWRNFGPAPAERLDLCAETLGTALAKASAGAGSPVPCALAQTTQL